jgi:hypothetical protein
MPTLTNKQATQRYLFEFGAVITAYAVSVFATPALIEMLRPQGAALSALALLPALPIAAIFVVMGRFLAAADEYVRGRLVFALLTGAAIVFSAVTAWDFLRVYTNAPPIPPFVVGPGFFAAFGLVQGLKTMFDSLHGGRGE